MENYFETVLIQTFTKYLFGVGYPAKLLLNEGSQFGKACEPMNLNFADVKLRLSRSVKVEY